MKVFIIGYYGAGNFGDEVLLAATINLLDTVYDSPKISVLSNNLENIRKSRQVEGINRNNYLQIIRAIIDSDMIIGGGGSMLQNVTSNKSLIYYLTILWLAKFFGKKVVLLGNGIGPLKTSFYKKLTMNVLKKLDAIVLRDSDSYSLLDEFGLRNIYLANDLAYTLNGIYEAKKIEKKILINLRQWNYSPSFIETIEKLVGYLIEENYKVSLISFQSGNDDLILREIYNRISSDDLDIIEASDYEKVIHEISSTELFIGMRLHGLIFSSICKTPFIGLSYDPKVSVLCESLEQEFFEDLNNISFNDIINRFEKTYKDRDKYREKLDVNTEEIKKLNQIHKEVLDKLR